MHRVRCRRTSDRGFLADESSLVHFQNVLHRAHVRNGDYRHRAAYQKHLSSLEGKYFIGLSFSHCHISNGFLMFLLDVMFRGHPIEELKNFQALVAVELRPDNQMASIHLLSESVSFKSSIVIFVTNVN